MSYRRPELFCVETILSRTNWYAKRIESPFPLGIYYDVSAKFDCFMVDFEKSVLAGQLFGENRVVLITAVLVN